MGDGRMSDIMKTMPVPSLVLLLALPVLASDVSTIPDGVRIRAGPPSRTQKRNLEWRISTERFSPDVLQNVTRMATWT